MAKIHTEILALVKLALPVSLAQMSLVGMTATDVLIAGKASTVDLAGMNLGANTWNMIALFFMGICFATQPLVAKYYGADKASEIKRQMQQSIWLALALGLVCLLSVVAAAWGMSYLDFDRPMRSIAVNYLLVMSLCAVPFCLQPALRGTLEGMSFTTVVFWINFSAFLLNIPLDYVLVNGLYGFPKLGGVGCAWATVILVWLMASLMAASLKWHPKIKARHLWSDFKAPESKVIRRTWRLGFPIGLAVFIELSLFCGAGMLIAFFGSVEASAHAVAITIASLSFMLYNGLAQGVTIRSSQFLGATQPVNAQYTVKIGIAFNLFIAAIICIGFLVWTEELVRLFSRDPEVIALAVILLIYGGAFQLGDSMQVAVVYALRAYHDTDTPPKVMFLAFFIIGLPVGVWLAFYSNWLSLSGAKGLWLAMVGSLFIVGGLLLFQLRKVIRDFDPQAFNSEESMA